MILTGILAIVALLSVLLLIWQWAEAFRFPLRVREKPGGAPGVTLLKPLKGLDAETSACLRSWFIQEYPGPVQILFGVADEADPVCEAVRALFAAYPKIDAQLVICREELGVNSKVSTLAQLDRLARHEVLIVSDADVRVPPDLLQQIVGPLEKSETGLVNCFYRLANPANLPMRWEAFLVNSDFWSQVLQAQRLKPLDFALGAVMATTRKHLAVAGGFAALLDYLADDYQLGHRIARSGARITLCPAVVECWQAPMNWGEVWTHQLRWARTIRVCRPWSYFLSILSNSTLWSVLFWVSYPSLTGVLAASAIGLRMTAGFLIERKMNGRADCTSLWLAPISDLLKLPIWLLAFPGNTVTWRGKRFRVLKGGKMVKREE